MEKPYNPFSRFGFTLKLSDKDWEILHKKTEGVYKPQPYINSGKICFGPKTWSTPKGSEEFRGMLKKHFPNDYINLGLS